ncbi:BTB/POZ domain-containing protein 9 isoform X2 [Malaya genurostris]|nr:BTB/POZ domain-containing protein 9 isoform X2 [Malaya genurostris]XP_058443835.1 BTB/POZ domain-containing protein 9 isoform X2 [Malaya genurostris]XP_058443836.1 BTB/POZ domain-containing protein 9 isoform X2 [Malaya genurostris]
MSSQSHKMSGPHQSTASKPVSEEIALTAQFSEQMAQLCMSNDYSDVTFIVENEKLPAHRVILAARSEYFRALLYGGLSESHQDEIHLKIPLKAFKALLKYIYSGNMSLAQMKEENILDTLGLANQYGFTDLEIAISDYLRQVLSLNNVCAILDAAKLFGLDGLINVCHSFLDRNAGEILQHETFKSLSEESICSLLMRDSFFAPEVQIFQAVDEWSKYNGEGVNVEAVVSKVRFSLMTLEQLLHVVRPSGILDPDHLLDAIADKTASTQLPYRGALWPEENVACKEFSSRTVQGEYRPALLDGDTNSYDMDKGYTRHSISDTGVSPGIIVQLGKMFIINHIKILLWDRDTRSYSYYVEVSVDQANWERVVDHTDYFCRSWQFLYFPSRAVRYIRLVGTHNTVNNIFHVVALEAMYTEKTIPVVNGIVAPHSNVATVDRSATVVEGVSRTRNVLLNGDVKNYDWDSGYTCHQLGSGVILVQLGQPYWIGSLRLLLWDCDERSYSFYIETSTNLKQWDMVVDKKNELLKSWQHFTFDPKIVVYIKIVGTHNTANEIFHCVHFECPSQDPKYVKNNMRDGMLLLGLTGSSLQPAIAGSSALAASASASPETTEPQPSTSRESTVSTRELVD